MSDRFDVKPWRAGNLALHSYEMDGIVLDVKRAWEMRGLEFEAPLDALLHVLYEPSWEGRSPLRCGHEEPHWSLTMEADLAHPVIVTVEPDEKKLTVVDGRHRVTRAWLLGLEKVSAKYIGYEDLLSGTAVPSERMNTLDELSA